MKVFLLNFLILLTASCGDSVPCVDVNNVDATIVCNNSFDPVCGCDNITYPNKCIAERSGLASWIGGPCP